jgi:two-component sensor histidine kinase
MADLRSVLTRPWWAGLLLVAVVVAAFTGLSIFSDRAATEHAAEVRVSTLSRLLLDHAERAIEDGEKALIAIGPQVAAWDLRDPVLGQRIFDELRGYLVGSPQLASAWIVGSDGAAVLDTWSFPSRRIDARQRTYYREHVRGAADPVLAASEVGAMTGKPRFTLSRAIRTDGVLHAIVVIAIYSGYFESLYREAISWPEGAAGLYFVRDGRLDVLARTHATDFVTDHVRAIPARSERQGINVLSGHGSAHLAGWQASERHPGLISVTSQSMTALAAETRASTVLKLSIAVLSIAGFFVIALLGTRASRSARALAQQGVLMREVLHRVKNNLAVVSSIVHAAERELSRGAEPRAQFAKVGLQITAIAKLYDLLQHTPAATGVNLGQLLERFAADASSALGCPVTATAAPYMPIDSSRAVTALIVLNELVTNAVKHATAVAAIELRLEVDAGRATITVTHPAQTLPAEFSVEGGDGFGLRMATMLSQSIEGSISVVNKSPATLAFSFPT